MKNRVFSGVVVAALLVMFTLVVFQGVATAEVAAGSAGRTFVVSAGAPVSTGCAFGGDPVASIHAAYDQARGLWLVRTPRGPAGVDGGALELRNCRAAVR